MKLVPLMVTLTLLVGCANMSAREKQTAVIVGAVLVGAIIISANDGNSTVNNHGCHGNCRVKTNED